MKRSLLKFILGLLAVGGMAEAACAQTTTVTAPSGSITMGGSPITTGTIVFLPVDVNGRPIAITKSGGGLNLPGSTSQPVGYLCNISNGGITGTCSLPDELLSVPSGFRYNATFSDTSTGNPTSGDSFTVYQMQGVTGSSFALNAYNPGTTVTSTFANTFTAASGAPSSVCGAAPSVYVRTDVPSLFLCAQTGGSWVPVVGSGGSSVVIEVNGVATTIQGVLNLKAGTNITLTPDGSGGVTIAAPSAATPTFSIGTTTPLAAGATPTATITGTAPNYVLNLGIPAGAAGANGAAGATPTFAVGTVTGLAAGATPTVTIGGTAPNYVLNFGLPAGATGAAGSAGAAGAAGATPTLSVGTVTSLPAGYSPTVTFTGTAPNYLVNFGIPQGAAGSGGSVTDFGVSQSEGSTPATPTVAGTLIPYIATDDTLKTIAADGVTTTTVKPSAAVANQWVTAINADGSVSHAAISSLQLSDVAYNLGSITKFASLPAAANYYNTGTSTGRFSLVTDCLTSACTAGGGTIMGVLQAAANGTWTVIEALNYSAGGSSITFPTGLLYGANSTNAPTAATSAQILAAIGSVPNANLASQTANTVLGAATATTPTGLAMPSCSAASNALTWVAGTGFGCNTISGSGTVNSGSTYSVPYYSGSTAVSGVSITGIPYFSTSAPPAAATSAQVTALVSALPDSSLASQAANTVLGSTTAASPSALAVPSCSVSTSALNWTSGTGFTCNTSISANTATTAGNVSGTPALPNGVTATTQTAGDTTTKLATDAFATAAATAAAAASDPVGTAALLTSGTTMVSPASVALGATATNIFPTYTLPANALGVGRCLLITGSMGHTGSHTWTPVLNIGSFTATIWSTTDTTTWQFEARFCNTTSTSNNYFIPWILGNYAGTGFSLNFDGWGTGPTATTINTTAAVPISITATGTSGDNAGGIYLSIQVI